MDDPVLVALLILVAVALGVGGTVGLLRFTGKQTVLAATGTADLAKDAQIQSILDQAKRDAERITKDAELRARDDAFKLRESITREMEGSRTELRELERRLQKREDAIETREQELGKKERHADGLLKKADDRKKALDKLEVDLNKLIEQTRTKLYEITNLSPEQAKEMLFDQLEKDLASEVANRIQRHYDRAKATAEEKAREIIITAVQRYAAEHTTDITVSTVDIPSDDMKGRIIGREGRNIRTFQTLTGVDVIVDDTPGVVVISAFDNVRRETARIALTKLIQDGRIHPTRIEEVVVETQQEMDTLVRSIGEKAVTDANVAMPHDNIVSLLGRLKFRTSYSQNVLQHSIEVAHLCGMMASELGLNAALARRCGLLHDIGKAADHEMEGGHPKVGAELAKRYGETDPNVLHAILGHHDDITIDHVYTVLVAAADAISASRPGARRETLERYIRRMEELEAVACGFPEVEAAYAVQAGRELRVIANANRATDSDAARVCWEIARSIEQSLNYPGEIKVTVIRESRASEIAR